ncbi:MAG TPA: hypothetical protein VLF91_01940 [Candidatus Saccharimonadales bacterium]|nr:hypothetical protein [Candidatus Saccharimonadales bacterium]
MKATKTSTSLLQVDALRARLDIRPWLAHAWSVVLAIDWSLSAVGFHDWLARLLSGLLLVLVVRLLLERLGASRLATAVLQLTIFSAIVGFSAAELTALNVVGLLLLALQEYFISRGKWSALIVTLAAIVLAAVATPYTNLLLILFGAALLTRVFWHIVLERLAKRPFVMFTAKALTMAVITPFLCFAIQRPAIEANLPILPPVHLPAWVLVILALLVLRGLWATLLVRTARSPERRLLRLFYAFLGLLLVAVVAALQHYSYRLFLPNVVDDLSRIGLLNHSVVNSSYALFAVMLFAAAGIDRSLFVDTSLMRKLRRRLNLSYAAATHGQKQIAPRKPGASLQ